MLIDGRAVPADRTFSYDLCIIGGGAAGITLARELDGSSQRVLLLEAGGLHRSRASQRLYRGEVDEPHRHGPLDRYRVRRLGGTTTVWGGCCAPFDAMDFEPRPHVPYSGWPIAKSDLDPFYERAHRYCELGSYVYDAAALREGAAPTLLTPGQGDVRADGLWLFSPPTDFGEAHLPALRQSRNVDLCLHGHALQLLADTPRLVARVRVASSRGNRFEVQANAFVLAAGGLETTRLLLLSDGLHPGGMGSGRGVLGRFYLSHLTGDVGEIELRTTRGPVVWNYERTRDGVYCRRRFSIDPARQRAEGLLNFAAVLDRPEPSDPRHRSGVLSAIYLLKQCRAGRAGSFLETAAHCANLLRDAGALVRLAAVWGRERFLAARRLPSVIPHGQGHRYTLHFDAEQSPNPESRVELAASRDPFGLRRLRVAWRFSDADVESVVRSALLIDGALRRAGIGRLLLGSEAMRERVRGMASVGSHHLGTTRMGRDPATSVVDDACRVHGMANLYVASSSVFPTSSYARPTLTIVALAIRLADYLKRRGGAPQLELAMLRRVGGAREPVRASLPGAGGHVPRDAGGLPGCGNGDRRQTSSR